MRLVQFPPPRLALLHPAVRSALVLLAAGPAGVAWIGAGEDAAVRLRLLGLAVVVVAAYAWDDRAHGLTSPTPVGLPAVRRGRALVVGVLLSLAFAGGVVAVPSGVDVPTGALVLQTVALCAALLAVVGWLGRDGDSVLAVPMPALLLMVVALNRLPSSVALLRADPRSPEWGAERARWLVLLAVGAALLAWWARDPAARRYRWRA